MTTPRRCKPICHTKRGRGVTAAQQTFNLHGGGSNPSGLTPPGAVCACGSQAGEKTQRTCVTGVSVHFRKHRPMRARSSMVRAGSL